MRNEPFPLKRFTDDAVNQVYMAASSALSAATTDAARLQVKTAADHQRDLALARGPLLSAACTYLTLAQAGVTVENDDPEKLYHFAANAFRDLNLLQRAAECYFNAALVGYQQFLQNGHGNSAFARRSAGRAKAIFSDLGDDENSGDSHILQQRVRLAELSSAKQYPLAAVYWLWDRVSQFGTSPARWLTSTLLAILLFALLYPILISQGDFVPAADIQRSGFSVVTSSLAFSVGNLFQFGTLGSLTPASAIGQIIAIAHGIVAFVLVGTGATFLTRS